MDTPPQEPIASRDVQVSLESPAVYSVRDRSGALRHLSHLEAVNLAGGGKDPRALADQYVRDNIAIFTKNEPLALALTEPVPCYYKPIEDIKNFMLHDGGQKNGPGTTLVSYIQTLRGLPLWEAGLAVTVNSYGSAGWRVTGAQNSLEGVRGVDIDDPGPPEQWRIQLGQSPLPPGSPFSPYGPPITTLTPTILRTLLDPDLTGQLPAIQKITPGERLLFFHYDETAHKNRIPPDASPTLTFDTWFSYPTDPKTVPLPPLTLPPLVLPLGALPDKIRPNTLYVVQEIFFTLEHAPREQTALPIPWRAFVEVQSGGVLYVEAGMAACFGEVFDLTTRTSPTAPVSTVTGTANGIGNIFLVDPVSPNPQGTDPFGSSAVASSNPDQFATTVQLNGLWDARFYPHSKGVTVVQQLKGEWIEIGEVYDPVDTFPQIVATDPDRDHVPSYDFSIGILTDPRSFTTINAYYHCDALFRMLAKLQLLPYFPLQPIRVDPNGMNTHLGALVMGDERFKAVNKICFGPVREAASGPTLRIGSALDPRVVLHEFCHVLLLASVGSLNLGFAHSAGDSLAAILTDPCCAQGGEDRYRTFPWLMTENIGIDADWRFHGGELRRPEDGWSWGGSNDINDQSGYKREQILSATLFHIYQVIGGNVSVMPSPVQPGSAPTIVVPERIAAARYIAYLIIRAISTLPHRIATPTTTPAAFATALIDADTATVAAMNPVPDHGIPGGSIRKVIQWAFAQRGAPVAVEELSPVIIPTVDVCIGPFNPQNDYKLPVVRGEVWNRQAPYSADQPIPCGDVSEPVLPEHPNFIYVCARNSGTATAKGVKVLGYAQRRADEPALDDLVWDRTTWIPLTAPATSPNIAAGETKVLGPLEWTPPNEGRWCVLVAVSADGDLANIDPSLNFACTSGPVTLARLVPFDNNIAARQL